jgi:8-oxo-dGTP pyrophosphatase MutT (NUDIX family)
MTSESDDLRRLLAEAPSLLTPRDSGDADLRADNGAAPRKAAVLVPLVKRPEGTTVLLTQRTTNLSSHAGQVSFPGGMADPTDPHAEFTALRETAEEVGLTAASIEIVGRLGNYHTRTGYDVTPIVGLVHPPFTLSPNPREVAAIFEVPLSFLLDPRNRRRDSLTLHGAERFFHAFQWQQYYIWGATAGMLVNLLDLMAVWTPPRGRS